MEFVCEFPGCGRSFETKTGRSLHQRRGHPDWFDARQNLVAVKARWSEEETQLLARQEAELVTQGTKFINQSLVERFLERTLEAIKGKRKQPAFRRLVNELLEEAAKEVKDHPQPPTDINQTYDFKADILEYIRDLPAPVNTDFNMRKLLKICESLASWGPVKSMEMLAIYMNETFPHKERNHKERVQKDHNLSRRQQRRAEYARVQDLWRKNRSTCLRMILDEISEVQVPAKEVMIPYWKQIITNNIDVSPGLESSRSTINELWAPITELEIRKALPAGTTSAGPDGVAARLIRKVPCEVLIRIFNIIIWCGKALRKLLESITTLIPKKSGANLPGDFRPITVSSVFIRTLHKVLSTRMAKLVHLDPRQRAFRPTDGCSDNIFLLDLLLRYHHKQHESLYMASLDIAKAFDSVSHKTIEETLRIMGIPEPMTMYIIDVYARSSTLLCCDGWTSTKIHLECGVKQGDPMSPIIFNMIIDRLLKQLPPEIGVRMGGLTINAAAFADDMLLFASTPMGLQKMLNLSTQFLNDCGLKINASKSMTVALRNMPHEKKTVVDKETVFLCEKKILPALKRSDDWKYLGVPFTPEGRARSDVTRKLSLSLERLTKAPLKPQQRMFALRTMVIPGLFHQLELGNNT